MSRYRNNITGDDVDNTALYGRSSRRRGGGGGGGGDGEVVYAMAGERALLMPDLRGRSLRDAARICAQLGLELEARGEGRALRQFPEGGAAVESGQIVRVEFGRSD